MTIVRTSTMIVFLVCLVLICIDLWRWSTKISTAPRPPWSGECRKQSIWRRGAKWASRENEAQKWKWANMKRCTSEKQLKTLVNLEPPFFGHLDIDTPALHFWYVLLSRIARLCPHGKIRKILKRPWVSLNYSQWSVWAMLRQNRCDTQVQKCHAHPHQQRFL